MTKKDPVGRGTAVDQLPEVNVVRCFHFIFPKLSEATVSLGSKTSSGTSWSPIVYDQQQFFLSFFQDKLIWGGSDFRLILTLWLLV